MADCVQSLFARLHRSGETNGFLVNGLGQTGRLSPFTLFKTVMNGGEAESFSVNTKS